MLTNLKFIFGKLSIVYPIVVMLSKILQYFKGASIVHLKLIKVNCRPPNR